LESHKERILEKLEDAKARGEVDPKVAPILDLMNKCPAYVTTSSCAGRLQLIQLRAPGDKKGSQVLGKWHEPTTTEEVWEQIQRWGGEHVLFLLQEPVIFHVSCASLEDAIRLRNIGDRAGLKHSTIRSVRVSKEDGHKVCDGHFDPTFSVTVELLGTERLEVPIGKDSNILSSREHVDLIVELANGNLRKADEKLKRLEDALEEL